MNRHQVIILHPPVKPPSLPWPFAFPILDSRQDLTEKTISCVAIADFIYLEVIRNMFSNMIDESSYQS